MDLWRERMASPMQSMTLFFSVGGILAPQIAKPFLSLDARIEDDNLTTTATLPSTWSAVTEAPGESRIEISYSIVAIIVCASGFSLLATYLRGAPEGFDIRIPSGRWKDMIRPSVCGHGSSLYAIELLVLLAFYFVHTIGGERTLSTFIFSFAVDAEVQFSKDEASLLHTAYWSSFTTGSLIGVPIARYIPIWLFILCDGVAITILAIVFCLYADHNRIVLWTTSCLLGLFTAVAFPNGMSWSNVYLNMNTVAVMVLIIGGACGGFAYQYVTGYLFDISPRNLGYVLVAVGCLLTVTFVAMQLVAVVHNEQKNKRKTAENAENGYVNSCSESSRL